MNVKKEWHQDPVTGELYLIVDIYARLSKEKTGKGKKKREDALQEKKRKYTIETELSLDRQVEECRKMIAEISGWREGVVFREIYTAPHIDNRVELSKARLRWANGDCDVFLCYHTDRIARGYALTAIVQEMRRNQVQVASSREHDLEYTDDENKDTFMLSVKSYTSGSERDRMIDRVKSALAQRVDMGVLPGSNAPVFGYRYKSENRTHYEIEEEEAKIVRRIFEMRASGISIRVIARTLNTEKISSPYRALWTPKTVSYILRRQEYIGIAYAKKYLYSTEHIDGHAKRIIRKNPDAIRLPDGLIPAIVSTDLFYSVQSLLDGAIKDSPRNLKKPTDFLLRGGYIHCAHCNSALRPHNPPPFLRGKKKKLYQYDPCYKCSDAQRVTRRCASGVSIRTKIIDKIVWQAVLEELKKPVFIKKALEALVKEKEQVSSVKAYDETIKQLEQTLADLYEDYQTTPKGALRSMMKVNLDRLSSEIEETKRLRQQAIPGEKAHKEWVEEVNKFLAWCDEAREKDTYEDKRRALKMLEVKVYIAQEECQEKPRYDIQFNLHNFTCMPPEYCIRPSSRDDE